VTSLSARRARGSRLADSVFRGSTRLFAAAIIVVIVAIAGLLIVSSRLTWQTFGLSFLTGTTWDPVAGVFGALPFVVGTLVTAALAMVIAAPIGVATAIFLAELAPAWLAVPLGFLVELLAGIPSVVIGLWGVFVLSPVLRSTIEDWLANTVGTVIPLFAGPTFGVGIFAAGIILAIVVPFARSGIIGALILGLGRALGETMAVTMVIGNNPQIPTRLFDQGQTISSQIATTFNEASIGLQTSSLIALGFTLLAMTIALNVIARFLVRRVAGDGGGLASAG